MNRANLIVKLAIAAIALISLPAVGWAEEFLGRSTIFGRAISTVPIRGLAQTRPVLWGRLERRRKVVPMPW